MFLIAFVGQNEVDAPKRSLSIFGPTHDYGDYLCVFFNTEETHSDRAHACIPTLAFGKPAKLYIDTPRAALFDQINAGRVTNELTHLHLKKIEKDR